MKYSDYNEKKVHGKVSFPIGYYHLDELHPQYVMPLHWHNEFEIIRVEKGEFELFLDNERYSLKKGDVFFINSGILHRGEPHECVYDCVVFNLNMLKKHQNDVGNFFLPLLNGTSGILNTVFKENSETAKTVKELSEVLSDKNDFFELEVFSALYKVFALLYKEGKILPFERKQVSFKKAQTLTKLIDWIEENFTSEITLGDLSRVSGLSEKYVCRIFKEYTSQTPISYINRLRIDFACHEMLVKKISVTAAAFDCGFNDLSYFSKTFKKYKGVSPHNFNKR